MTTNKNPASAGTLGGAGNDDLAARGSDSKVKRDTAPKQPGAPRPYIVDVRRADSFDGWIVKLGDGELRLSTADLQAYQNFCIVAMDRLGICFAPMTASEWADLLHEALNGGKP